MAWYTNHSFRADTFKLQWEKGSTMCKGKTHMQGNQENTAVTGKKEDNSAIVSRCKHRTICCRAKMLTLHRA